MKLRIRTSLLGGLAVGLLLVDVLAPMQARAIFGARRRTALMTAAVVSERDSEAAAAKQQPATTEGQTAAQPEPAPAPAPASEPATGALPIGTIVHQLPSGCTQTAVGGVAYQKCGPDYYRAAFQGSDLVYVTTKP